MNLDPAMSDRLSRSFFLKARLAPFVPAWRLVRRARMLARHALHRPHDPDFAAFGVLGGEGLFLDIGANAGQSALSFRVYNRVSPILSLEPLPEYEADLRFLGRFLDGHRYLAEAAAEHTGDATLLVPRYGRYRLSAEASLNRAEIDYKLASLAQSGADPKRLGVAEIPVRLRRLDELALAPEFVKIDVEGGEPEVVRGLEATLERHRPVLMIERSARIEEAGRLLVDRHGYAAFHFDRDARAFRPTDGHSGLNLFFLPPGHPLGLG